MLSVSVQISGTDEEIKSLQSLASKITDFTDAMNSIGDELIDYYSGQAFASQGGVYGDVWQSLAASTQAYKIRMFTQYATQPLIATGKMQDSFTKETSSDSVYISNSSPYFVYHQSDEDRSSNLPRRQMIGINDDVQSIIQQVIQADIEDKIGQI